MRDIDNPKAFFNLANIGSIITIINNAIRYQVKPIWGMKML